MPEEAEISTIGDQAVRLRRYQTARPFGREILTPFRRSVSLPGCRFGIFLRGFQSAKLANRITEEKFGPFPFPALRVPVFCFVSIYTFAAAVKEVGVR